MHSNIAISVCNVSKKFRLFISPKERLLEALHPLRKQYHHEFWALRDVSFDVRKGETLGILGRNGSGKSTILQIICSVMQATQGEIQVNGRISALLELGAGFNPEFTGRDNVILNGAIIGISRKEMLARMPEIEEFADVGQFFDQPVKTYSSGMFVRVAFAAAINVDPDILIIDEALSVGDTKFQNKCFQKFHEFREKGKTIVLVTHSMETVNRLCDYAVLLEHGRVVKMGSPNEVTNIYFDILFGDGGKPKLIKSIGQYNILFFHGTYYALPHKLGDIDPYATDLASLEGVIVGKTLDEVEPILEKSFEVSLAPVTAPNGAKNELEMFLEEVQVTDNCVNRRSYNKNENRTGDRRAEIVDYLCIRSHDLDPVEINPWDTVEIYMKIVFHQSFQLPVYGFTIKTVDGIKICGRNTWLDEIDVPPVSAGEIVIFRYEIKMNLAGGDFFITLAISDRVDNQYVLADHRTDLIHIHVQQEKEGFNGFIEMETKSQIISQTGIDGRDISA